MPETVTPPPKPWRQWIDETLHDHIQRTVLLAAVAVSIVLVLLVANNMRDASRRLTEQAVSDLATQTLAISANLQESLRLADFTARKVRREWLEMGALQAHAQYVEDIPNFHGLILQVAVIGSDGWLQASSLPMRADPVYLGDRAHFRVHQQSRSDRVFISQRLMGRVSGQASVQFTRPILRSDGTFAGVVVLSLDADYLQRLVFDPLPVHEGLTLILDAGGRPILAQVHGGYLAPGAPLGADARFDPASFPGLQWLHAPVDDYPLSLAVGSAIGSTERSLQHIRYVGWTVAALLVAALMIYVRHITGLVRQRNELMRTLEDGRRQAVADSQTKSRFISSVSHELRTPLNGILGFAELVEMADSLPDARAHGRIIHQSAAHLSQLVNRILDLSKIEAGQMELRPQRVSVQALLEAVVDLHRLTAVHKGLLVQLRIDRSCPDEIVTDPTRLTQVFNNLLHNAVKFTHEGLVSCEVSREQGRWRFIVQDTGVGMDAQQLNLLFDRFNNVHADPQAEMLQGAGLGMTLVREIVTLMGGEVEVRSTKGQGTIVSFSLPDLPMPVALEMVPGPARRPAGTGHGPAAVWP